MGVGLQVYASVKYLGKDRPVDEGDDDRLEDSNDNDDDDDNDDNNDSDDRHVFKTDPKRDHLDGVEHGWYSFEHPDVVVDTYYAGFGDHLALRNGLAELCGNYQKKSNNMLSESYYVGAFEKPDGAF